MGSKRGNRCAPIIIGDDDKIDISIRPLSTTPTIQSSDDAAALPRRILPTSRNSSHHSQIIDLDADDISSTNLGSKSSTKFNDGDFMDDGELEESVWGNLDYDSPDGESSSGLIEDVNLWTAEDIEDDDVQYTRTVRRIPQAPRGQIRRNSGTPSGYVAVTSYLCIMPNADETVELRPDMTLELWSGEFFRITKVFVCHTKSYDVLIRGHRLRRTKFIDRMLDRKLNEVCMVLQVDKDDPRDPLEQAQEDISLGEAMRIRRLILTNQSFPRFSFRDSRDGLWQQLSESQCKDSCQLVCRWKFLTYYDTTLERESGHSCEKALMRITQEECYGARLKADEDLRQSWYGETNENRTVISTPVTEANSRVATSSSSAQRHLQGRKRSHAAVFQCELINSPSSKSQAFIDLSEEATSPPNTPSQLRLPVRQRKPTYTFGDGFCGAGGMSRGARMSGLDIKWGLDSDYSALKSYRLNFPDAEAIHCEIHDFFAIQEAQHRVAILHLSPPCQTFSSAHTVEGKNDDANTACYTCVDITLLRLRPRILTLEETAGLLLLKQNRDHFAALIKMITDSGYSVRWKIANLVNYGVPQSRNRLFIFASCPGEKLPEFPAPTHSRFPEDGLRPWLTVREAISTIRDGDFNHDVDESERRPSIQPPWDPDRIAKCITTSGGQDSQHYSGRRPWTHREFATLQGFPREHRFDGTGIKRQIGNAVPPVAGKIFMNAVKEALWKADGY